MAALKKNIWKGTQWESKWFSYFNNKLLHLLQIVLFYEVTTITSYKLDRKFKKLSQVTWGPEPPVWEEGKTRRSML